VLHVGAYECRQNAQHYYNFNKPVICIVGNPEVFESLLSNITKYENQRAFNSLISSRDGVSNFFEVSNKSSSSISPINDSNVWRLRNVEKRTLPTVTLSALFDERELSNYDLWVVDVQGAELEVLKGAEKLLVECCKYLFIEVSINSQYLGGCEYSEIKSFLINLGFVPAWDNSSFHADVMFMNSRKLI
jgi:FkbM family methyltransferase